MIMAVSWILTLLSAIVVTLRFYVRATVHRAISSDDWFMLAAMVVHLCMDSSKHWLTLLLLSTGMPVRFPGLLDRGLCVWARQTQSGPDSGGNNPVH